MTLSKIEMTEAVLAARSASGLSWHELAAEVGLSPVFLTSACLGMNSLSTEAATRLCARLDLPPPVSAALQACPHKHWAQTVPTDPLIYRLYEIVGVYGETLKTLIHEEFGDGIMSAIDFSMDLERVSDPAGDRVKLTLNGKFLPYRAW